MIRQLIRTRRPKTYPAPKRVYAPDRIGIVGFHSRGFIIAKPVEAYQPWLLERSQQLHQRIGDSTNITDGLRKGIEMAQRMPPGVLRRLWLLSDGEPNRETSLIMPTVQRARQARMNINTIGFGDRYDRALLERIARATHNGRFVPVRSLRELTDTLVNQGLDNRGRHHRSETTILVVDLSPSMNGPMDGKTKVQVVEEAIMRLILYKQRMWS